MRLPLPVPFSNLFLAISILCLAAGLMVRDRRLPALRQYERLRTVLGRELGLEPSDESEQLYRQILEGRLEPTARATTENAAAATAVVAAQPPSRPERSRRRSQRTVARRPNNLPVQLSSFIGREREMRDIERLLAGGRALTLTGPGGAGKTRLAIEAAAAHLTAHDDGVWLVELAGVSDPAGFGERVRRKLKRLGACQLARTAAIACAARRAAG